nr:MOSC domain-containing protein [Halospina sp. K52047b]
MGDAQGDRKHHGGTEKAVHQYCLDHYPFWRDAIGSVEPLAQPGAFGENLVVSGLTEDDVCIGDTWAVGDALLQVSQARRPCWRLNERFGVRDMARRVTETGRTGWYYRVLTPGIVATGDTLELRERPHPEWPLSRLFRVLLQDRPHPPTLEAVAGLTLLSNSWRDLARQRAANGKK